MGAQSSERVEASVRPFRAGDESALAAICVATADAGKDAAGQLADDDIWGELFVLPYVARYPELAFVVQDEEGRPIGYIVGATDTAEFERWFGQSWWPRNAERWPMPP